MIQRGAAERRDHWPRRLGRDVTSGTIGPAAELPNYRRIWPRSARGIRKARASITPSRKREVTAIRIIAGHYVTLLEARSILDAFFLPTC